MTFSPESDFQSREDEVKKLQALGYAPIGLRYILGGLSYISQQENTQFPYSDSASSDNVQNLSKQEKTKILTAQTEFLNAFLPRISIVKDEVSHTNRIIIKNDGQENSDITPFIEKYLTETDPNVDILFQNKLCLGKAIGILKDHMDTNRGVVAILDNSMTRQEGPNIQITTSEEKSTNNQRQPDKTINADEEATHLEVLKEIARFKKIQKHRIQTQENIDSGQTRLLEAFTKENWPTHPLMERMKEEAIPIIKEVTENSGILCDQQDIRYQTLFRLTTLPIEQLFENGDQLHDYMESQGSLTDWQQIPHLDRTILSGYNMHQDTIEKATREQLLIIQKRLEQSTLPLEQILIPQGIFAQEGWQLIKSKNDIFIINPQSGEKIPIDFRPVDQDIATAFHNDLHYIHTPRSGQAFGMFLPN